MRTVLAALDSRPAPGPIIDTAVGIAKLMGATVGAVHVRNDASENPPATTDLVGVGLRVVDGPVEVGLLRALSDPNVIAGVFGARANPSDRRPVGYTALHVLERTSKPVVIVPPAAAAGSPRSFRRLLLPLEGSEESARPVAEDLSPLILDDVELIVLHVFTPASAPPMLDHAGWDLPMWGDEFLARLCPNASRIDLRTGAIASGVTEACAELDGDLIVLSWAQDMSPGHAAVVRDVLERSVVPVLLLPVDPAGTHGEDAPPLSGERP